MVIDCDVHHTRKSSDELLPYLKEPWKSELAKYGGRYLSAGILSQEGGNRGDTNPPGGGPPGSDPEHVKKQLLDPYDYRYAILTGTGHHITGIPDADYASAMVSAWNDHTIEHWLPTDKRFKMVLWVAHQDPLQAAQEIERLGDHPDVVSVWFSSTATIPFGNRFYHPIYEAAQRHNLPIGIHPGNAGGMMAQPAATAAGMARTYLEWHTGVSQIYMAQLTNILLEGIFERFPRLGFYFVEGGIAWLPHLLWRLDSHYKGLRQQAPWLKKLPSDYIADHVRFTTQPLEEPKKHEHLAQIFDMIDAENILMFASDYPHWDFDEPTAVERKLPSAMRQKVLHDNAAKFLRLS
jgi:predicted TIM-barrel fold metal-dependent hydrolase